MKWISILCQYKFATVFQLMRPSKSIFRPFELSSDVIMHLMEHTQVNCTCPSNTPTCMLQLSSNITKVKYLSSCAPTMFFPLQDLKIIPMLIWPCYMQIPFVSLCHIKISQTWYQCRAHGMLHCKSFKCHTDITFKPLKFPHTCTLSPVEKFKLFHIFHIWPHGTPG